MAAPKAANRSAKEKEDPANHPWITDSVLPIVQAKRAEVVRSDHQLNELVQFIPTPGHTIDHFSVLVGKAGQDALHLLARTEAILLDPVYSAKAMAALIADVRAGKYPAGSSVVFIHTGGVPAIFADPSGVLGSGQ